MKRIQIAAVTLVAMVALQCGTAQQNTGGAQAKGAAPVSLKEAYKGYFDIGVAVSPRALQSDEAILIKQHFNSLTPENAMKMGPIQPREGQFFWRDADSIAAFTQRNGMKMRGHTLLWHKQAPSWFFTNAAGDTVSRDVLLQRMKAHISAVAGRYKGRVYAWDVVNEVISDNRNEVYHSTPFLRIIGEDFIEHAFRFAHEADPDALLFYNDYNEIDGVKRGKIIRMIQNLRAKGVPIHGVGLQAHWAINEPSYGQLDSTLGEFAQLGLPLHITEIDISVYPKEHSERERKAADADTLYTAAKEKAQVEKYKMCFELFRKYNEPITSVTFWNISDRHSWLDDFPVRGRKDYPLLFDRNLQPKKAYWEVVNF